MALGTHDARRSTRELSRLTRRAVAGEDAAWTDLVRRLNGVLRAVVRVYRLGSADVDDVVQTTWLEALRYIHRLNDPEAIAAWLIVTARREALRTLQRGTREVLAEDPGPGTEADPACPQALLLERERHAALCAAVQRLPGRQRELIAALLATPTPSYEEISRRLDMPIGSIGPTRERALVRLREDSELERLVKS